MNHLARFLETTLRVARLCVEYQTDPADRQRIRVLVDLDNVGQVRAAGARRIAVSHAICSADDPRAAAQKLRQALR